MGGDVNNRTKENLRIFTKIAGANRDMEDFELV